MFSSGKQAKELRILSEQNLYVIQKYYESH